MTNSDTVIEGDHEESEDGIEEAGRGVGRTSGAKEGRN